MIQFHECQREGYSARTRANISNTDITLAFANNFKTPGEICTQNHCRLQGKLCLQLELKLPENLISDLIALALSKHVKNNLFDTVRVNIAGNSLTTLNCTQEKCDSYLIYIFQRVFMMFDKTLIKMVGSGGQTGFDEAGLKMAVIEGISAECIAPKNWMFRLQSGRDICDEELFKNRFK